MSLVFRARDQHLDREVALKMLRPHLTETDQGRFRREIKALARLNHPGIVTIYDLGRSEAIYFIMELVEGGLFTDLGPLEPDPEPLRKLLEAAISVAEALHYVHQRGMVHRDLTPRNILLTAEGYPKVMDFGLVQLAETTRELTRTGLTLGTPHYMAPEQAKGEATGAHTDLYAFGAVLYKAVTGITPFDAENDQAILYQHVYGNLSPLESFNPYVPEALENLILDLLAKNPVNRPSSGKIVAESLRSILTRNLEASSQQRLAGGSQQGYYPAGPVSPMALKPVWHTKLPEGPQWPAALTAGQGFIFIGLRSEEIRVLRSADGSLQARFEALDEVNTAPLLHQNRLIINSRDGSLCSLLWPKGEREWLDSKAAAVGVVPCGRDLLISTRQGTLERRNLDNQTLWQYRSESPATAPPLIHQLQACIVTQEGWVHCIDVPSGKGKFKIELGAMAAAPSGKDGILLLPERDGELHAFDMKQREVLWTYDLGGALWASPICWQNFVYAVSWHDELYCLSLTSGDDIWKQSIAAHVTATPIVAAGTLYLVTESGFLLAYDASTGKLLYEHAVSTAPIQASPLISQDTLVVAALDGTVKGYRSNA
jgi:serine/threonine-protein kinase